MAKRTKREYVWMECSCCGSKNYRTPRKMEGAERMKLMKYCPFERKHTLHLENRKK